MLPVLRLGGTRRVLASEDLSDMRGSVKRGVKERVGGGAVGGSSDSVLPVLDLGVPAAYSGEDLRCG